MIEYPARAREPPCTNKRESVDGIVTFPLKVCAEMTKRVVGVDPIAVTAALKEA